MYSVQLNSKLPYPKGKINVAVTQIMQVFSKKCLKKTLKTLLMSYMTVITCQKLILTVETIFHSKKFSMTRLLIHLAGFCHSFLKLWWERRADKDDGVGHLIGPHFDWPSSTTLSVNEVPDPPGATETGAYVCNTLTQLFHVRVQCLTMCWCMAECLKLTVNYINTDVKTKRWGDWSRVLGQRSLNK